VEGTDQAVPLEERSQLLNGGAIDPSASVGQFNTFVKAKVFDTTTAQRVASLAKNVPTFTGLLSAMDMARAEVKSLLEDDPSQAVDARRSFSTPEEHLPDLLQHSGGANRTQVAFRELLLIQALRPDRVIDLSKAYVRAVFGDDFLRESADSLRVAIDCQTDAKTPIMLFGTTGYDASTNLQDIAKANVASNLVEISVGSPTAFKEAEDAIRAAEKRGGWVILKNVHLAPKQLDELYKGLRQRPLPPNFRLFFSTEINEKLPTGLLMNARSFVFEPAAGVKASLQRSFSTSTFSAADMGKAPAQRGKLYFLVAWLHAIIQERLRYTPLGWSKKYEFGEPDLRAAILTVNQWMDEQFGGRASVSPSEIPFPALRELLSKVSKNSFPVSLPVRLVALRSRPCLQPTRSLELLLRLCWTTWRG
jgi:hypothetical protein